MNNARRVGLTGYIINLSSHLKRFRILMIFFLAYFLLVFPWQRGSESLLLYTLIPVGLVLSVLLMRSGKALRMCLYTWKSGNQRKQQLEFLIPLMEDKLHAPLEYL